MGTHPILDEVTPDERRRAGSAVAARIRELDTTSARIAAAARVDRSTMSALIHGRRWPHTDTRRRIAGALGWPNGEIERRGLLADDLGRYTLIELLDRGQRILDELRRRVEMLSVET